MGKYKTYTIEAFMIRPAEEYRSLIENKCGYIEEFTGGEETVNKVFNGPLTADKYIQNLGESGKGLAVFKGRIRNRGIKQNARGSLVGSFGEYDYKGIFNVIGEVINPNRWGLVADCPVERELVNECKSGCLTYVEDLIEKGADPKYRGSYALQTAAVGGHLEVVKYLVEECGCDINNNLPAQQALYAGHLHVVKYLVSKGASLGKSFQEIPLAAQTDKETIEFLHENGYIDEDKKDNILKMMETRKQCLS